MSYLDFYFKSGNAHGLHSPFVFDLYTNAIRGNKSSDEYEKIEAHRKKFLANHSKLKIEDAGAGSTLLKAERKVSDIARHSISGKKKCELLFRIVNHLQPGSILELGTSLGISTAYLHLGNKEAELKSIEADTRIVKLAKSHLNENIELLNAPFDEVLPSLLENFYPDLIYIDGNHQSDALIKYVDLLMQKRKGEITLIIDDIYWSEDMNKGWKKLVDDKRFGISIDLYHFGLLFTRKKQPKQHFRLRL